MYGNVWKSFEKKLIDVIGKSIIILSNIIKSVRP